MFVGLRAWSVKLNSENPQKKKRMNIILEVRNF